MDEKEYESVVFTLTDEDGNELEFEVIGSYEANDTRYLALIPLADAESNAEELEYVILKVATEGDEEVLVTVDDDDEFDDIADYFDDLFSSEIDYDN